MAWKPGHKLKGDRYVIERTLGRGRSAITYLAYDDKVKVKKVKKRLVIKTLSDEVLLQLQHDPNAIAKLQDKLFQEATKLAKCQHRHVVRCVGDPFRERDGNQERVCVPMEYIAGVDLASLPQKHLSETDALHYIRQIGEALICVHSQGLLHRDIKPENILVRHGSKEAVLIDFDLARETDMPLSSRRDISDGFAPVELYLTSLPLDARTDVYSLAATLYYLVTGEIPPTAEQRQVNPSQYLLVEPKNFNSNLSDRLNKAILYGMALEPGARPENIKDWLKELGIRGKISVSTLK
ncbi:MAG: serine/threonine-protein kinase [Cyanobacteriota bacterium]|nr:serine/threonine-protein kinase [Cyanobacteriota bacterium]